MSKRNAVALLERPVSRISDFRYGPIAGGQRTAASVRVRMDSGHCRRVVEWSSPMNLQAPQRAPSTLCYARTGARFET